MGNRVGRIALVAQRAGKGDLPAKLVALGTQNTGWPGGAGRR